MASKLCEKNRKIPWISTILPPRAPRAACLWCTCRRCLWGSLRTSQRHPWLIYATLSSCRICNRIGNFTRQARLPCNTWAPPRGGLLWFSWQLNQLMSPRCWATRVLCGPRLGSSASRNLPSSTLCISRCRSSLYHHGRNSIFLGYHGRVSFCCVSRSIHTWSTAIGSTRCTALRRHKTCCLPWSVGGAYFRSRACLLQM